MRRLRDWLRAGLKSCGYSVHRWPANRFDGTADALLLLRGNGYTPRVVIDAGANVGNWTRLARSVFGEANVHMIEPQPACRAVLEDLVRRSARLACHPVAITEPGVARVRLVGGGTGGGGTGARVARTHESAADQIECPATTLDTLFALRVTRGDRTLLKLDLEGHEEAALRGAAELLRLVEVVLLEVQFFQISDNGGPVFLDVAKALAEHAFDLYDVASLSQRPRDQRLRMGDIVFVRRDSELVADRSWQ